MLVRDFVRLRCAGIAMLALALAAASLAGAEGASRKVIAPSGVLDSGIEGVTLWHDYGSFALYRVSDPALDRLPARVRSQLILSDELDRWWLLDAFDVAPATTHPESTELSEAQKDAMAGGAAADRGPALHLVQFVGPIKDEWLGAVETTGATLIQYIATNGYLLWADADSRAKLDLLAAEGHFVQASQPYPPALKIGPSLVDRIAGGPDADTALPMVIQMYRHDGGKQTEDLIADLALSILSDWEPILSYQNIVVTLRLGDVDAIVQRPDVYWIEERLERHLLDEVQGQIMAANFNADQSGPAAPGYLPWLGSFGFSTDPADYPIVDVTDDGIGNGTVNSGDPTLHELGDIANPTRLAYVANCTNSASGEGVDGHGHINTSIVGGYDERSGFPFQDPLGYQRGLGINPYGRLAGTRVFDPGFDQTACGSSDTGVIKSIQDNGALVNTNSWGCSGCAGTYDDSSQAYDVGVRDADLTEPGNQEMIILFSAGNSGPSSGTVGTPGNGKNMITVGASENQRPSDEDGAWTDGCNIGPSGADDAMDVISFSSRGPSPGSRVKPEVIAPGTHIQGTASTNAGYTGNSVCDQYRPSAQTVFAASSGTSHSTPAVAGSVSLAYWWLENSYGVTAPSPAMMKAYLIAHPTYLTGVSANDTLPSNSQGYGMPNMSAMFDAAGKFLLDQSVVFDNSGETWTWQGAVADSTRPVRIVLTFTDAPGAIGTSPQVNDLNLAADVAGTVYLGNVFSGQWSTTGGSPDPFNNYEAIFLPAGTDGAIDITVTGFNIAGDGVPNSGDGTDQDFAIVCYNCAQTPTFSLNVTPATLDICAPADALYNVDVGSILGFSDPVTLAASGNPAGTTASFSVNPVTPPGSSTLTVGNTGSAAPGSYSIDVTGTATAGTKTDTVDLNLFDVVPVGPALLTPADGAVDVPFKPTFSWTAVVQAASYLLEVATDAGFTNIVYSASETGTSHTTAVPLGAATTYYWRVTAGNICGTGTSATFSFTTQAATMVCNGSTVDFEDGIPADWTVVNNAPGGIVWVTTADPACEIPNRTNGSGEAACADSDAAGSGAPPYDTELVSNPIDLSTWGAAVLDVKAYYNDITTNGNDRFEVDVWDGASWTNELTWDEDHLPEDFSLNLSAYTGQPTVQVRFRYSGNGFDWYAQVDDIALTCVGVSPPVIEVDPAALSASQGPDIVSTQPMTITNSGGSPLNWSIAEDGPTAVVLQAAELEAVDARQPQQAGYSSALYWPQASSVLLSEGFETGVFPPDGWTHGINDPDGTWQSLAAGARSGSQAAQVLGAPPLVAQDEWLITPELTLSQGTLSFWSFGSLHWCRDAADQCGLEVWLLGADPGGADDVFVGRADDFWTESFTWSQSVFHLTPLLPAGPVRIGFRYSGQDGAQIALDDVVVDGTSNGACASPEDVPWLSASPSAGATQPLDSTVVDVSFDTSGMTPGGYSGYLCVTSDDPGTPLVAVPAALTVEPPVILACNSFMIEFEDGIPSGWAVVDNTGGSGIVWVTTADPACEIPNRTNGSGEAACADSDAAGLPATPYDTELWSNVIDLSAWGAVVLDVKAYYNDITTNGNDRFEVDVWDGATWTNELSWDEDHMPEDFALNLSAYAGLPNVRVRFRYFGNGYDWYAQVDDIALTCAPAGVPVIEVDPAALAASQGPDVQVTQPITVTNSGGSPLNWNIVEDDTACDSPADIPWLSVSPNAGTTTPLDSTVVDVTFDSTGLTPGDYTANLCVNSDDPATPLVQVPVTLTVLPPFTLACNGPIADFETGVPPSGWQVIDNEGFGVVWTTIAGSGETGNYTGGAGDAATASSDRAGAVQYDTELRTAGFDLAGWLPSDQIALQYLANYQNFAFRDYLDLDISTDGGATWTTLLSWNEDHGSFRGTTGEAVSIDLSPYAGMSGLRLRWHYYDPTTSDFDWYAQIDEVGLACVPNPAIDVDPAAFSSTQVPGQVVSEVLTVSNIGSADLVWSIEEDFPAATILEPAVLEAEDDRELKATAGYSSRRYTPSPDAILLSEGFEDGAVPPPGWSQEVNNPNQTWKTYTARPHTGAFAANVVYDPALIPQDEWLLSPTLTLSEGTLSLWSFGSLYWCRDTFDNCDLNVWLVVGDPGGGDDVFVGKADDDWTSSYSWSQSVFDLTALLPGGPVRIGLQYSGLDGAQIALDDIVLDGTTAAACDTPEDVPWLSASPTGGTTPPGASSPVDVARDATALTPGLYQAVLCVNSNDPVTPRVVVPVDMTVSNVPPVATVQPQAQDTQYSDEIVPLTITAMDNIAEILTAVTSWSSDGVAFNPGLPDFLALSVPSCVDSGGGMQTCTWMIMGPFDLPEGVYTIRGTVSDNYGGLSVVDAVLDTHAEDATVVFDTGNPVAVPVAAPGGNSGPFSLTMYVTETEPDMVLDPAGTPAAGDISRAVVTVTLLPVGPGSPISPVSCATAVAPVGYAGEMTVVCDFNGIPVNTYTVQAVVDGGYYSGTGEDVLTVYDPSLGFTTGGGWFYWPGTMEKTNFGYTMKYNKKGVNPKGSLLVIRHLADGSLFRLKSNALDGLALGDGGSFTWASFSGKATYQEPGWPEPLGNYRFLVYVEDHGEPGSGADRFWIEVRDKSGNLTPLALPREAIDNAETLEGGNIVVPH